MFRLDSCSNRCIYAQILIIPPSSNVVGFLSIPGYPMQTVPERVPRTCQTLCSRVLQIQQSESAGALREFPVGKNNVAQGLQRKVLLAGLHQDLCALLALPQCLEGLGQGSSGGGVTWTLLVADLRTAGLETPKGPLRCPATPAPGQRQRPRALPDSSRAGVGSAHQTPQVRGTGRGGGIHPVPLSASPHPPGSPSSTDRG